VIGKRLFEPLEKMAKFRNVVVHQYETIDPSIVVSILHKNLADLEKYKKTIIQYFVLAERGKVIPSTSSQTSRHTKTGRKKGGS
jgi:uncharacterized protein YutE (UPF0331/DUF86 family)